MKVKDIGETGLLKRLQSFCPPEIVGDDAAIIPTTQEGKKLVVTTDMLVEGVHFSDRTTSPRDTGWRATAANLSDIAAMGASPMGIAIALGITGDTEVSWVEALYQGISDCLQPYNSPIVGGDVARAPLITIAITAFGEVAPNRAILRSHCQPGNVIVATGAHGSSRAGLELLLNPELGEKLLEAERCYLVNAHQRPRPRLDVLPVLWSLVESQAEILIGGMDSSDGLADAIVQMCRASKVGARIERDRIPRARALSKLVAPEKALEWALYGGEDFELVLSMPAKIGQQLVYQIGEGAAIVGTIMSDTDIFLIDRQGIYSEEELTPRLAFQHF
jgi:thiamine-monophosphate kinase